MVELGNPPDLDKLQKQANKLLQSMRIRAWYQFVVTSGVDLKTIRLRSRGVEGRDTYRRWNHWKNGNGKVEEDDLIATEKKVSNSREVYDHGPEGARLWHALGTVSGYDINEELQLFEWTLPWGDEVIKTAKSRSKNYVAEESYMPSKISIELGMPPPNMSIWHKLTHASLIYHKSANHFITTVTSKEEEKLYSEKMELGIKDEEILMNLIDSMSGHLDIYGIESSELKFIVCPHLYFSLLNN